ncbi:Ap4A phosphorylase II [Thioalkalivibrio nitratireducens DSM 14787]|uniref:Ap4A phosphorylase II n=1 Tax=Thioalkalivibrio nitratireducens (strain DSM 14787 / UNIQEM 213 / ALEN2) TaxID=1255043 RepID=L0DUN2_THIND|nr:phosphorylase [Thioalkalivibrio nitratireducens]AGA32700.1 Ap4A phosphorylase II [Thioalkalivibrio nitratireducens DSM 14787]
MQAERTAAIPDLGPGALWPQLLACERHALARGALQPIETEQNRLERDGVTWLLRRVSSLARKAKDRECGHAQRNARPPNPFLPPEPDLTIGAVGPRHLCIFNKFNVIEHHILLVTREFEHQECLLTPADLATLAYCLREREGLGFYNGGRVAGASQPHKHLQWIPLPLDDTRPAVPIAPLLDARDAPGRIGQCPSLPIPHAFVRLESAALDAPEALYRYYAGLLQTLGFEALNLGGEIRQSAPYNLLLTRDWMLAVPRTREHHAGISVNALGFAGSLFVMQPEQLDQIAAAGPLALLQAVTA